MNLRSVLRQRIDREAALKRLSTFIPGSQLERVGAERRYLELLLANEEQGQATALLDVDLWFTRMELHLPGIPWQQVPVSYITRWLKQQELSFMLAEVIWDVRQITISPKTDVTSLVSVPTQPCPLLVSAWPTLHAQEMTTAYLRDNLDFHLRLVLGYSQLGLSDICGLTAGDLLIIKDSQQVLTVGWQSLFTYRYINEREVVVENVTLQNNEERLAEEEVLIDWTALPVDIEFVLDSSTVTLGYLEAIAPGSALPVAIGAEKNIRIYLNRKLFATGELVALEEGGFAVEVQQVCSSAMI